MSEQASITRANKLFKTIDQALTERKAFDISLRDKCDVLTNDYYAFFLEYIKIIEDRLRLVRFALTADRQRHQELVGSTTSLICQYNQRSNLSHTAGTLILKLDVNGEIQTPTEEGTFRTFKNVRPLERDYVFDLCDEYISHVIPIWIKQKMPR